MTVENRFNLIDEPWIPVVDKGRVSIRQIFTDPEITALGGNPVQKISLTKLLLAIAQAASTPADDEEWAVMGAEGMAKNCLAYLDKWYDRFWLYGEKPFLQMPAILRLVETRLTRQLQNAKTNTKKKDTIEKSKPKQIGVGYYPDLPAENNTILTQSQVSSPISDAEKCIFLVMLMSFAFGGKRVEKELDSLTPGYFGKSASAKPGPSLGNYVGYLHTFVTGDSLIRSIWLNIYTLEQIDTNKIWSHGLGIAPWERMPEGESCDTAIALKNSYMGTLVSLSRFVLYKGDGVFYVEGLQYPTHKEGWVEPTIAINNHEKTVKVVWVDPNKRPWRQLVSLLSFMREGSSGDYDCQLIRFALPRARNACAQIGIWSGGLRVRGNSGDQSVKQDDDFVESKIILDCQWLGKPWYEHLKQEMTALDDISRKLFGVVSGYYKSQKAEGEKQAGQATNLFWQLCEPDFQQLVNACNDPSRLNQMRKHFASYVNRSYDAFCPKESARQLDAWAKNRPNLGKYLTELQGAS